MICLLASEDASYSTGSEFAADGGHATGAVIESLR